MALISLRKALASFARSLTIVLGATTAPLLAETAPIVPPTALQGYGLDWLAPLESSDAPPNVVKAYSMTCGKCQDELAAIAAGNAKGPNLLLFSGINDLARDLALPVIACGLAQADRESRQQTLFDLFTLFSLEVNHYLQNPKDWTDMVKTNWGDNARSFDDPLIWAFALNVLDTHSRFLSLANSLHTPAELPLDKPVFIPKIRNDAHRRDALMATLCLPWLRPPLRDAADAAAIPGRTVFVSLATPLEKKDWHFLERKAKEGVYWLWTGPESSFRSAEVANWLAGFHLLPNDAARKQHFLEWLDTAIERSEFAALAPIDSFGVLDMEALASPRFNDARSVAQLHLAFLSFWDWMDAP